MLSPAICDRARLARDRRFDGRFFTGVVTTGIYCRPICPVQPARSANVRFFPTAAAAEMAGFRPCLRCRPEAAPGSPASRGSAATVSRGLTLIDRGFLDEHGLLELASVLGIGPRHLTRVFVRHCGAPPGAVARTRRLQLAKRLLDETTLRMTDIALAAGYASVRRFNGAFRATYKRSPSDLRGRRALPVATADGIALRLYYRPPYDWPRMLRSLSAETIPGVECVSADEYRRTISLGRASGWLSVRAGGDDHALHVTVRLADYSQLKTVIDRLRVMFDLQADPAGIARALQPLVRRVRVQLPPLRVPGAWDGFEVAVRTIVALDAPEAEAHGLLGAFVRHFGQPIDVDGPHGLDRVFPRPDAMSRAELTRCGLPARTAARIDRLACCVAEGAVVFDSTVPHPQLVDSLVIKAGLDGPSAEWISMRTLGEPDADVARWVALPDRVQAWWRDRRTQEALRPWRSYAALALGADRRA
jgi:AraC family transcriptional regulator of adaptative response / DNA-3-methyladenine glycosylase II